MAPQPIDADAYGVAALSIVAGLIPKLIEKGVLTYEEAAKIYNDAALFKMDKALQYGATAEADAENLIATLAVDLERRAK